jgi:hypothetical protein
MESCQELGYVMVPTKEFSGSISAVITSFENSTRVASWFAFGKI